jgi:hypothetical protein
MSSRPDECGDNLVDNDNVCATIPIDESAPIIILAHELVALGLKIKAGYSRRIFKT